MQDRAPLETENIDSVITQVLTLSLIKAQRYQFIIPSYQRPYVWPNKEALKLFNDINESRCAGETHYFIGTVLSSVKKGEDGNNIYELIDGQQRSTTLMLIALAFKMVGETSELANIATYKNEPRLKFSIRQSVQQLIGSLAGLDSYVFPGKEAIDRDPYLQRIYAALKVLEQQVRALPTDQRESLSHYIFHNVKWVNNIVPAQMDLNSLFSTMNTAGIQLEQSDILKSKLLKRVKTDKPIFDAIWVSCEHMDNYFEQNLRKAFPNAALKELEFEELSKFNKSIFSKDDYSSEQSNGLSIAQLADKQYVKESTQSGAEKAADAYELEQETVYCRSIISFPLLLIHAYRIHLAFSGAQHSRPVDVETRIHQSKLLETFAPLCESDEAEVKRFLKTLWQVRYQFDRWVVKWVERDDSDDEQLRLTEVVDRSPKKLTNLAVLQSVRNFTGESSAQYWITPFIAQLIKEGVNKDQDAALKILEKIDNVLSLAADSETQKTASFKQACNVDPDVEAWESRLPYFRYSKGTSFEHYWFQKLEYLLWKNESDRDEPRFKAYRITAKNSIEHVYPQHEEYKNNIARKDLDSFGNLALLSPGENSSYSNQAVKKKLVDFEAKAHFDSLKLKAIFELVSKESKWAEVQIHKHEQKMLSLLSHHYNYM